MSTSRALAFLLLTTFGIQCRNHAPSGQGALSVASASPRPTDIDSTPTAPGTGATASSASATGAGTKPATEAKGPDDGKARSRTDGPVRVRQLARFATSLFAVDANGALRFTEANQPVRVNTATTRADVPLETNRGHVPTRGRAPAHIAGSFYWVGNTTLWRSKGAASNSESLAVDALPGTRVSALAARDNPTPLVAYIARSTEVNKAKLWWQPTAGEAKTLDLTESGNSALSVQLNQDESALRVWQLEARLGVTALHARTINPKPTPTLGPDRVVWVGGTTQSQSEIVVTSDKHGVSVLIAMERDASHFGLAHLRFDAATLDNAQVTWLDFANGINPAPVVAGLFCGKSSVLFARPTSAAPQALQELVLAELDVLEVRPLQVLSETAPVRDLAWSSQGRQAWLAYTTAQDLNVLSIECASLGVH